jgi:hypothetical protein
MRPLPVVLFAGLCMASLSAKATSDTPVSGHVQAAKDRLAKKEVARKSVRNKWKTEAEIMSMLNVSNMDAAKKEIEHLIVNLEQARKAILSTFRTGAKALNSSLLNRRVVEMETMSTADLFKVNTIRSTNQLLYNGIYKVKLSWFEASTWLNEFCQTVVQQMSNLINLRKTRASYSAIMRGIPESLPAQPNFSKYSDSELLNQLNKLTVD